MFQRIQEGTRFFHRIHLRYEETLDTMFRWQNRHSRMSKEVLTNATTDALLSTDDQYKALWALFRGTGSWRRVWTMQELPVSQKIMLLAGRETLDWGLVVSFLQDDNKACADAFHVTGAMSRRACSLQQYSVGSRQSSSRGVSCAMLQIISTSPTYLTCWHVLDMSMQEIHET
ncbi:hypothetical protein F5Y18DRAFT_283554 [Xylariaceae sp. FL1019]|nr:hypothetical protein F5Y18DRAFT_283554 [Xylariaceae sp. FL1019]